MKTLRMYFANEDGKTSLISLNYAKDGLTAAAVQTAMASLVSGNIFSPALTAAKSADIVDRSVTELIAG